MPETTLKDCERFLTEKRALLFELLRQQKEVMQKREVLLRFVERVVAAREMVNAAAIVTQDKAKSFIEEVVSLALASVYGEDYGFEIEYSIKRNKSEAKAYIVKGGSRRDPRAEVGGGVIDVCSFGLRMVLWAMTSPRTAPVFFFDEPFRFVSKDLSPKVSEMVKSLSELLGVQIVLISHDPTLIDAADRVYRVAQQDGISTISREV
jgi:DNA repair exonuclease SbcCD ATPase subunit